jgi:hypothetical protein
MLKIPVSERRKSCHSESAMTTNFFRSRLIALKNVRCQAFGVLRSLGVTVGITRRSPSTCAKPKSIPTFVLSALQSMKILFSCEDFSEKSLPP